MFLSVALFAAPVALVQSTEWITIRGDGEGQSVRLRALAGMTHKPVPNADVPFYHSYSGDVALSGGRISMVLKHVQPDSIKAVKDDFAKEALRVGGAMPTQFSYRTIEHGGYRGELRYLRSPDGTARICDIGFAPVAYVRFIVVTGDLAEQAENIIAGATFSSRRGAGDVYPSGFPHDWSYSIGPAFFNFGWPQEAHTTEFPQPDGTKESVSIQSFRYSDGQLLRSHLESPKTLSPLEAAKRTYPTPAPLDRLYSISKVDVVKVGEHRFVRSRGTSGGDQFLQEYVAWTGRTSLGRLQTLIAYRKPGGKWPKATPMDPEAPGEPVTDDAWPDTVGIRSRPLRDGGQTIWLTSYEPGTVAASVPDVVQYGAQDGVAMAVALGATAERLRMVSEPKEDGATFGPWGAGGRKLAYGFVRYGELAWSSFFQYDSPGYGSYLDRFYVKQKDRLFVVEQTSDDAGPNQMKLVQERYASFKGSAERPFLKEGRQKIDWIVPAADFRSKLSTVPHFQRLEDRRNLGRAGNLSGRIGFVGGALYVSVIDGVTSNLGSWHSDIIEEHERASQGKTTRGDATVRGRRVEWHQTAISPIVRLTTFSWKDLAKNGNYQGAIHMRMPAEAKPDAWIAAYEAAGFKFADGK